MDLFWKQDLGSPQDPGIYPLPNGRGVLWIRRRDIDESKKCNGKDLRCSCFPALTDADGNDVYQISMLHPVTSSQANPPPNETLNPDFIP